MSDRQGQTLQVNEERLQIAAAICARAGAELVYLFGSQVSGKVWAESDADIAVLLGPGLSRDRYGAIRVELIGELMSVFESNRVDVVILNEAPPLLTYEGVIRGGRLLFERDRLARIRFEVRAFQEYVDTAPLREVQNRYLKEAIRERAAALAAGRLGLMPEDFARRFSGLAGFRNILIHEYAKVDASEVYRNLRDGLADFDRFAEYARLFLEKES